MAIKPLIVLHHTELGVKSTMLLTTTLLRQELGGTHGWRQVKRAQLRKLFLQAKTREHTKVYQMVDARGKDDPQWFEDQWKASYSGQYRPHLLKIGCVFFNERETRTIRRWALGE